MTEGMSSMSFKMKEFFQGKMMAIAVKPAKQVEDKRRTNTKQRRVVVTGMGVMTPLRHEPDVFYNNLLNGISGISEIENFDCAGYPTRIAGKIKSFSTDGWVVPKLSKRMDKFMLYMLTAGKKALVNDGITKEVLNELDKTKCGVFIGSAMGGMKVFNDAIESLRVSYKKMIPFCVTFATTNMSSAMLAMDMGWMGPNYSISTASATSNFCILNAANHIIRGEAGWEVLWHVGHFHKETMIQPKIHDHGIVNVMDLLWEKVQVYYYWKNSSMLSKEEQTYMLNFWEEVSPAMLTI
ncbi:3-oxoacyl-[acyl-carrier-protein] synthase II, chloroplastic-like isoform X8 [Asparagus officinalis]|uniref:3-oxoacyl-[acyl-carrier-protein] synthase II, chloroplastic-like isoform X8 n=1 Tax=Asparagus officinalis TaxID=4686 RepID=UPI00098E5128|nr:3-oxoacyl-[acyl-carrier-protein] synthase II, chloroplastic-like isoform X8 [Asparagus officinalis]XP_020273734.1 3-oxoacyl-[acyl-carrier-protein] synthase II, chloroplastic-like isoform X8 [Asparagus officinalis]XP_020273735.1 3-oxoacyl-[acyl-carrier-protein] synthase II, chloroplastic-like isoform X8 [Asparagus officinalis]XP_020273736.1 3-oxoacyl-[acyl-carrier-protein] synthase II, chloroplastic-like isoform X8 [Asparagus officinalis]